jgi:hypothetical protein
MAILVTIMGNVMIAAAVIGWEVPPYLEAKNFQSADYPRL